jgi:uracil-DNA glycosylase
MMKRMTTYHLFNLNNIDPSWQECLTSALSKMDAHYLNKLSQSYNWLPGHKNIFNAFTLPVAKVNYVLFGESPYPRAESANGYAFWDAAVTDIWSTTGLSKLVNRATSLRNIIKMLLVANGLLHLPHTSQPDIAQVNKEPLIKTNQALFSNFLKQGFLLLNTSLVLQPTGVQKDALAWQPFLQYVLNFIGEKRPQAQFILLGNIATTLDKLISGQHITKLYAEHPYNISFISNPTVLQFFNPLNLLTLTDIPTIRI